MIGSGFESSLEANYSCVFTSLDSSRMAIHMRAIYVSTSQLNCSWKPWPFPAGASSVKLLRGTEQVPTNGAGPYFFNFITSWNSFLPDGGIAFGGTEVTVIGGGFHPGSPYFTCKFECSAGLTAPVVIQVPAVVDSPSQMRCVTVRWDAPACTAMFSVWKRKNRVYGNELFFQWSASWSKVNQSSAPASGGFLLQITGSGFNSSHSYRCIFSAATTDTLMSTRATPSSGPEPCTETSCVQCETPLWPTLEGDAILQIEENGKILRFLQDTLDNGMPFVFTSQYWLTHFPKEHYIGREINITIVGSELQRRGQESVRPFQTSRTDYSVVFQAREEPVSRESIASEKGTCVVFNETSLICRVPYWGHAAATTSVQLYADQVLITNLYGVSTHLFKSHWDDVRPSFGSVSGGEIITIFGHGFDMNSGRYKCRFHGSSYTITSTFSTITSSVTETTTALVHNPRTITCTTPMWRHGEQFINLELESEVNSKVHFLKGLQDSEYEF